MGALGNLQTCDISNCSGCKLVKFFALPFNQSIYVSSSSFNLIHSDVWRPSPIATKEGSQYYIFLLMIILIIVGFI
jgi:cytosine/uracil/thiamine/allantoin permease